MDKHNEQFTRETVDEQVDELLQSQLATSPDTQMVQDLSQLYKENPGSLEQVWHRLGLDAHMSFSDAVEQMDTSREQMISQVRMTRDKRKQSMLSSSHNSLPQRSPGPRFTVLVAVLVVALLVGSMLLVLNNITHSDRGFASPGTITQTQGSPSSIYIGGVSYVARLDKQTGKQLWKYSYSATGPYAEKIIVFDTIVYVGMVDLRNTMAESTSAVLAIDAQTGHLRWSHTFKSAVLKDLVTAGNRVYVGNDGLPASTIYALDTRSGAQYATYQISGNVQTLSVTNSALYVGSTNGLSALSLSNGKQLWYKASMQPVPLVEAYIVNKVLYIAIQDDGKVTSYHVAAFNTSTGEKLWQGDIQSEVAALAVVNDKVFVGTVADTIPLKGSLRVYDAHNGKLDWTTELDGMLQGAPAVDNNLVYVSIFHSTQLPAEVAALTLDNGHIQWRTPIAAGWVTQAAVSNRVVYVSRSDSTPKSVNTPKSGTITALNAANGRPIWTVSVAEILVHMVIN
jgi:outer membrane protein assembly factor BamB